MSALANQPAFPISEHDSLVHCGMTLRQYYAGLAMQGILSNVDGDPFVKIDPIVDSAVIFADALIRRLEETK